MTELHLGKWPRAKLVFMGFAALAAALLIAEHRLHLLPYLPWLFLLACAVMHVFHRGHGHRDARRSEAEKHDE